MKNKYKIGSIVRIKATGEKVRIVFFNDFTSLYYVRCMDANGVKFEEYHSESELKPYCPTRAGKRDSKGRFVSRYHPLPKDYKLFPTPEKIEKECGCNEYTLCGKHAKEHMFDPTPTIGGYHKEIKKLIDAHYALEERVKILESESIRDFKQIENLLERVKELEKRADPIAAHVMMTDPICRVCGKPMYSGNTYHFCTSGKAEL